MRVVWIAAVVALSACGVDGPPGATPTDPTDPIDPEDPIDPKDPIDPTAPIVGSIAAGLVPVTQLAVEDGHMMELVTYRDLVYVADHGGQRIVVLRAEPSGALTRIGQPLSDPYDAYTTLAVHEGTATLFAGYHSGGVRAFSLADPTRPVERPLDDAFAQVPVRDLHVARDTLLMSSFDRGLQVAAIDDDGGLTLPVTVVDDHVSFAEPLGDALAVLTTDGRLLVVDGDVTETVPIDGPALGMATDGPRLAVAMGSEGVVVFERVASGTEPIARLTPAGVVADVDLDGDRLVAFAVSGVFAYELSATPRLFGFHPAGSWTNGRSGYAFSGEIVGDEVFVSEWVNVSRFQLDPEGAVLALDHQRGLYVPDGAGLSFAVRNVGDEPRILTTSLSGVVVDEREIAPESTVTVTPDPARVGDRMTNRRAAVVDLRVSAPGDDTVLWSGAVWVLFRSADADPALGRPAPGDTFPSIGMRNLDSGAIETIPAAGTRTRVVFYSIGCAAMWAEMIDASWLAARGELDDGASLVLASPEDERLNNEYDTRWLLPARLGGYYMEPAPSPLAEMNAQFGDGDLYFDGFQVDLPGDAQPTDYLVDDAGSVVSVERMYRGRHALRP